MTKQRTESEQQIAELLRTAKSSLQISVAFMSRLDGTTQHLEVVDSSIPLLFREGVTQKQETTLCQAVIDGDLPPELKTVADFPNLVAGLQARGYKDADIRKILGGNLLRAWMAVEDGAETPPR